MEQRFYRVVKGLTDKGELYPAEIVENRELLNNLILSEPEMDWYRSAFSHKESIKSYFEEHGSVKGYTEESYSSTIVFDFDSEDNVEQARKDVISILNGLSKAGVPVKECATVSFSGNKGFNLYLYLTKFYSNSEQKSITGNIAKKFNLTTYDSKIYNSTRILRIENTRHQKSGRYKIPLKLSEVKRLTSGEIIELASSPRLDFAAEITPLSDVSFFDKMLTENSGSKRKKKEMKIEGNEINGIRGIKSIDWSLMPKGMPRCLFALSKGVMRAGKGERHHIFLRLAAFYRNQGLEPEVIHHTLKGVAELNHDLYPEHNPFDKSEIWTIVKSVCDNREKTIPGNWGSSKDDEILQEYCDAAGQVTDKQCVMHQGEEVKLPVKVNNMINSFQMYAKDHDKNIIHTGFQSLDKITKLAAGTVNMIVGCSGSGKTSLVLNMIENSSIAGQNIYFASLDMSSQMMFLKMATKCTEYNQEEVLEAFKHDDKKVINFINDAIHERYSNVFFDFASTETIEGLENKIVQTEQQVGLKMHMTVVDYFSRLTSRFSEDTANASYNALKSVDVAKNTNTCLLYLAQIARQSGNEKTPLLSKRLAKSSSSLEEICSMILNCWRPGYGLEDQDYILKTYLCKNRFGTEKIIPMFFDKEKSFIRDLTSDEMRMYKTEYEPNERDWLRGDSGNNGWDA